MNKDYTFDFGREWKVQDFDIQLGDCIKIYSQGANRKAYVAGVIMDADSIIYSEQELTRTKGFEILEFVMPKSSPHFKHIKSEAYVSLGGRTFNIKQIEDVSFTGNKVKVTCYATWYRFAIGKPEQYVGRSFGSAQELANNIWNRFGGSSPRADIGRSLSSFSISSVTLDMNTPLYLMRYLSKLYNIKWVFGSGVDMIPKWAMTTNEGFEVKYLQPFQIGINMQGIKRTIDSTKLTTAYHLLGKDKQEWSGPNGAKIGTRMDWLRQNYFLDAYYLKTASDERFTVNDSMTREIEGYLENFGKPIITYEISCMLLDEIPIKGGQILIVDETYGIFEWRRISERRIDYLNPAKSTIVLADPRQELIDLLNDLEGEV